jgi:dihydrofolate reductase
MAIAMAEEENPKEIHIGGGAEIYRQALPFTKTLHVTWVYDEPVTSDTFFPAFEDEFKIISESGDLEHNGLHFEWVSYERK